MRVKAAAAKSDPEARVPDGRSRSALIVSVQFPPWGGGGVLRMTKMVKYLARLGWSLAVISSDEAHPEVVDETLQGEIPAQVRVLRIRGPFRGPGGVARVVASRGSVLPLLGRVTALAKLVTRGALIPDRWIGWAWRVGRLRRERVPGISVVISSGPPHSAHLGASRLARRMGVPHVVDLRDDWGLNPLLRHPGPWHGPIDRFFEKRCLLLAAHVVCAAEDGVEAITQRLPALRGRVSCIPNGYDREDIDGLPGRTPVPSSGLVRFLFAGSLRSTQEIGSFFQVFGDMSLKHHGELSLRLLGLISPQHEAAARAGVPEDVLRVEPPVPHAAALREMASADVLILFTGGGGWGPSTMTGKLYEYLAMRRPILLVGPLGPAANLVLAAGAGVVAPTDDPRALAGAIGAVMAQARDEAFTGASSETIAAFERGYLAERWSDLLSDIVRRGQAR
jgi:glycosyltransferase involved in cell wall biosynthesis